MGLRFPKGMMIARLPYKFKGSRIVGCLFVVKEVKVVNEDVLKGVILRTSIELLENLKDQLIKEGI
ncbi:hypothetical protein J2Z37_005014 [Ammoniphilus resinae]|uniref:Uncharacterized protein n=1 Tax=Ammoniphilus resinae TaxID=861532 RepID=A0ABS4GXJ6_9BACL|nr:hypothetical protein [Ammoniphilus resinae]